jgi:outer membrane immunogenic protein
MNRLFVLPLLAATILTGTAAQAQQAPGAFDWSGFYFGLNAGWGQSGDDSVTTTGVAAGNVANVLANRRPGSLDVKRDGFVGGGQVGYNWQRGNFVFGLETDLDYTDLSKRSGFTSTLNDVSSIKQKQYYLGTARARLGYAWDRVLVYGTGGYAYGRYKNEATFLSNGAGQPVQFGGAHGGMGSGWTAGGGIEYALPTNSMTVFGNAVTLRAEYLYYDLGERTLSVNSVPGVGVGSYASRFENNGNLFRVGLNFKFGGAQKTAVVQQTRSVAPAPVAVQAPKSYLVFFDFDRSDLSPEGSNIVQTAAANAKSGNVTRINVTGHTDRSGSDAYNERLSRRRAQTVQAELERSGIPGSSISVVALGESQPLVATAEGVREPLNRRVEIVYQ